MMLKNIPLERSLLNQNPQLASQWHPTKNKDLTPRDVTPGSNKRAWWICDKGHEWEAIIGDRAGKQKRGCPYCSNRRASKENNLAIINPLLAAQWHPDKNGNLTPRDVTSGSNKKVWWRCCKGHEWQASIQNRSKGRNCPYCGGKKVNDENCLATLLPELAAQWHPNKNGPLTPRKVTKGSGKKVWWLCSEGHEWKAAVADRAGKRKQGCPYCSGKRVNNENCLAALFPEIASQWDPDSNGSLTPRQVRPGSHKKIWWRCKKGHRWQTIIADRTGKRKTGCPYCSNQKVCDDNNLEVLNPAVAALWHPKKNGNLTPKDVVAGSDKKVWWVCEKGHEWKTAIHNRTSRKRTDCPYCSNSKVNDANCLETIYPEIAFQWHPVKNGDLSARNVTPGSTKIVWWICKKGHEWKTTVANRTGKSSKYCPYCSHHKASKDYNLAVINPVLAAQWHPEKNGQLRSSDILPHSNRKVWWICKEGHEWKATVSSRHQGCGCPYCSGRNATKEYNLAIINPVIAGQWHPDKNGTLTPYDIRPGSGKAVWWVCEKGHQWKERIVYRTSQGTGCPYCSHHRVCKDNNLAVINPVLASQWHLAKNGNLTPSLVLPHSNKKVWWICKEGHEWEALINERAAGNGCPYCSNHRVCDDNNLAIMNPSLAIQWHPVKNGSLTPRDVTPGSGQEVWWICKKNHEWKATIATRNGKQATGCPYCSNHKVCDDNNLAVINPALAVQWHPEKNGLLTPRDVTPGSNKTVWWICSKGHEWQAPPSRRISQESGCPYCCHLKTPPEDCLAVKNPELSDQWDFELNGDLTPYTVTPGSSKKAWWICDHGHKWPAVINSRVKGHGCPYCTHQKATIETCLATLYPHIASEWHPEKNGELTANDVTPGSGKKIWWKCSRDHEWQSKVVNRTGAIESICPICKIELVQEGYYRRQ